MKHDIIDFLKDKSLLILGFGREGKSFLRFVQDNLPEAHIAVADQNEVQIDNIETFCGDNYLTHVDDFDIVIKSPGVAVKNELNASQKAKITSCTDLFLRFCQNPIIGVTGTKGKSTTASLTYHILHKNQRNAIFAGNIGKPCFDIIDEIESNTIIVLELSCHQLEYVQASPHVAILLNLYEEHFDHYAKPEDYFNAKKNIFHFQHSNDLLIYGDIFQHAHQEEIDALPMHKINLLQDHIVDFSKIKTSLIGEHYKYDIAAAIAACEEFGLSEEQCLQAVASFKGLRHRLEFVGEFQGIKFYNDSIATAQEAVIQAINAVPNTDTIILGGMDRGLDYHPLVDFIRHSNIRNVILLPDTDATFQRIFDEAPYSQNVLHVTNLEEAVKISFEATAEGHSCLLSPAAASYGFFKNFEERGDVFCQLVQKYAKLKAEA